MNYSVKQIAEITDAQCHGDFTDAMTVSRVLTDSRSLLDANGTAFFAISTPTGDGHRYIHDLYDKGVRCFVVGKLPENVEEMPDGVFLIVPSVLDALHALASHHRAATGAEVVAVIGSRGKTVVKEWISSLLKPLAHVVRSPRSYNSQIGVPLSLLGIEPDTGIAVIEAGISRPGEMSRLEEMVRPDTVVFTNIGAAHSLDFESVEQKCVEKSAMMRRCRRVVYNADDQLVGSHIPADVERIGWTRRDAPGAVLKILSADTDMKNGVTRVDYDWKDGEVKGSLDLHLTSEWEIEDALHALAVMMLHGATAHEAAQGMGALRRVSTRLDVVDAVNGSQMIHDRFSGDVTSLALALDFVERRRTMENGRLTVILGDLDTSGHNPSDVYAEAGRILAIRGVNRVIGIGPEVSRHASLLSPDAEVYPSLQDFLSNFSPDGLNGELILISGSPRQPLTEVTRILEKRRNETVLEINLDAVTDNFNFFRSRVRPTTGIVCMIKASGYGAGSHELAKTLQSQGASYLAVAVHDEGVDLRQAGITMPVIVLNPAVDHIGAIFDNRLEPEIYSIDFLRSFIAEAEQRGETAYPVHIKVDSGMHRLGFRIETLSEVIAALGSTAAVAPASIFSHLCCADDPQEDDYTRMQFDYFDRCCAMLLGAFPERRILRHILNSTGITRFPDHQLDMVRLGIGLYGIKTMHDGSQDALRPVSTLRTCIISLKKWPAGTTVGYNRRGLLTRDSVIATVPVGYADGLNRHLGYGNARFNVGGVMCPTVGSICMDACMVDVTDVPDVMTSDSVEIFGDTIPVETLSDTLGTIPYEVLTSVSSRVKRVYYRE